MLKVTDICSTDPSKPNSCRQPGDIKIDRTKAKIWSGQGGDPRQAKDIPGLGGDAWHKPTIWFFRHCWADVSCNEKSFTEPVAELEFVQTIQLVRGI